MDLKQLLFYVSQHFSAGVLIYINSMYLLTDKFL